MVLSRSLFAGCALLFGCYDPVPHDCAYRCFEGICPDGLTCEATHCRTPDHGPEGCACDRSAAFGEPIQLGGINSGQADVDAWLSPDELEVYFSSTRPGGPGLTDLYVAKRSRIDRDFGEALELSSVNGIVNDDNAVLSADRLTLYFSSNPTGDRDVYIATRSDVGDPFGAPMPLDSVSSPSNDNVSHLDSTETELYLGSNRTGRREIYVAKRSSPGAPYGPPMPVQGVNDPAGEDYSAVLTADRLEVFWNRFTSASGADDIWTATRTSTSEPFASQRPVDELNSPTMDRPTWVSPDGCRIVLTSRRPGGIGADDIWMATR